MPPRGASGGVKRPRPSPSSSSLTRLCGGCLLLLASAAVGTVGFQPPAPIMATSPSRPNPAVSVAASSSPVDDPFSLRTPVPVDPLPPALLLQHADPLVLLGSCFSDNIGDRLGALKHTVDINPFGTSYNPISLQRCLVRLLDGRPFEEEELGRHPRDGVYYSFDHHTSFSHRDPQAALAGINSRLEAGRAALLQAKHLFMTLGTSHVYRWRGEEEDGGGDGSKDGDEGRVVANCHRLPHALFERRLLGVNEIVAALEDALSRLREANPGIAVTFTVSPVRHLRNAHGPVANARSKAHLLAAVHELIDRRGHASELPPLAYFPAFEIMMDDLRDYRFYDADMLHPSPLAVDILFSRLQHSHFHPVAPALLKSLAALRSALAHRPADPASSAHQAFLRAQLQALQVLRAEHPYLDLGAEERRVRAALVD